MNRDRCRIEADAEPPQAAESRNLAIRDSDEAVKFVDVGQKLRIYPRTFSIVAFNKTVDYSNMAFYRTYSGAGYVAEIRISFSILLLSIYYLYSTGLNCFIHACQRSLSIQDEGNALPHIQ